MVARVCISILLLLCVVVAFAQAPEVALTVTGEQPARAISEVLGSVTVLTADDLRTMGAQNLVDALRLVPGVTVRQAGEQGAPATVIIRGDVTPVIYLNLLPLGDAGVLPADLATFPVEELSRIEVVRGPLAARYGAGAQAGLIHIFTKTPTTSGMQAHVSVGTPGRLEGGFLYRRITEGDFAWQVSGAFPHYGGQRGNSDYSASDLAATGITSFGKSWKLLLRGEDYGDTVGQPGPEYASTSDNRLHRSRAAFSLAATRATDDGLVQLGLAHTRLGEALSWRGTDPTTNLPAVGNRDLTGDTDAFTALVAMTSPYRTLQFGGEYRTTSTRHDAQQDGVAHLAVSEASHTAALFAQQRWRVTEKLEPVIGLRWEEATFAGSRLTPHLGVTFQPSARLQLRAAYAEALRAPTIIERTVDDRAERLLGNPALLPEIARTAEVGARWQGERTAIELALFATCTENTIQRVAYTGANPWYALSFANSGQARTQGAELAWSRDLADRTRLHASYLYIDAFNQTTGGRLPGVPQHQGRLAMSHMVQSWTVTLAARWLGAREDIIVPPPAFTSATVTLPSGISADLAFVQRRAEGLQPYLVLRDLTDSRLAEVAGYPAAGRGVEIGARAEW